MTTPRIALGKYDLRILDAISDGRTLRELGAELGVSERTVKQHASALYVTLGCTNAATAVRAAIELRVITPRTLDEALERWQPLQLATAGDQP